LSVISYIICVHRTALYEFSAHFLVASRAAVKASSHCVYL